ncbi:pyrroline-5-carboxylate reductase dimerization domain-containing protein [Helicobacter felis]|uniref:Pyrroline-5-carboxylate reductase n=1 Tax=Helicobacter felis (strain ATCC 49179 / CCUG 28539 / NCTC 12436 / CS1) TaxID=936155 RepID=E7ADE1_HELFC|nr:pyrroline-5-carboxylate reductase dimerization domain-containing protein [Helicobacter felis]CBY83198.1 pyrroline-5-carboxylate reductase [Helicobacter felis ATCC 49179]
MKTRLLIVGYGNMARAILKGFAKNASKLQDHHIQITGRDPEKIRPFLETLPLEVEIVPAHKHVEKYCEEVESANAQRYEIQEYAVGGPYGWGKLVPEATCESGYRSVNDVNVEKAVVLLTMKPHALESFSYQGTALLVLSVLAGVSVDALKERIKSHAYVRCMPNVAAEYGLSATSYYVDTAYHPKYLKVQDHDSYNKPNEQEEDFEWLSEWLSRKFPHDFLEGVGYLLGIDPSMVDVDAFVSNTIDKVMGEVKNNFPEASKTCAEFEEYVLNHMHSLNNVAFESELQSYLKKQHQHVVRWIKKAYKSILANYDQNYDLRRQLIYRHREDLKKQISSYAQTILECFGSCVEVQSEALIDASLATNGSSLAFLSMAAQALVSAGVREGLSVDQASELVEQSFKGFAQLLQESDPQEIIDSICTPGGATIAGLSVLEEKAFKGILMQACHIAVRKGRTKFKSS